MSTIVGATSGSLLAYATLTGLLAVTAASEGLAQTLIALPPVTYDGVSPVELRVQFPLVFIPKQIEGRLLVRRADTHAVLGTLAKLIGLQTTDRVDTLAAGTVLPLPAGTYGLEVAGWSSLGGYQVEGGPGGPGEHLVPAYAAVSSVLTVPAPPVFMQLVAWYNLLLGLTTTGEIWALHGIDARPPGSPLSALQWRRLTLPLNPADQGSDLTTW